MRLKSIQLKPIHLTEEEAIEKAEEIRDNLVIGAEIISSFDELYKQLENIPGIKTVWRMKYYHLLFPTLLAPFYGQDIQLKVLHFLKQNPSSIPFIRMGQIALFIKKCNIPGIVFGHIWGKYANDANTLSVNDVIFAKRLTDITPYTDYIEKLTAIFAPDELSNANWNLLFSL